MEVTMRKVFLTLFTVALISSLGFAEMRLQLKSDLMSENDNSIISNDLKSNLKLEVPSEVIAPPADMKEFVKGMIILGLLADVSFPLGGDEDFGHIAGTGFSGHAMIGYVIANSWLITLRGGYVKFGEQTTSGNDFGADYTWTDNYNQIPILLGAYYLFNTSSAFKPYIGLALGLIIQNYTFEGTYSYEFGGTTYTDTESADKSSTGFGLIPALGAYYMLGSVMLNLAVEYNVLFGGLELTDADFVYNPGGLGKSNGITGIAQEETYSETYTISYFSVLLGVSFPIGK
jgi:outer membrane protein W